MREGAVGSGRGGRVRLLPLLVVPVLLGTLFGTPPAAATQPPPASVSCGPAKKPGMQRLPVRFGGKDYRVLVHLPKHYSATRPLPLLLNLHGSTHDGASQLRLSQFGALADAHGFIVAAPNGAIKLRRGYTWNVPGVPLAGGRVPSAKVRNDVAFLAAVARRASAEYCVDARRIYVTGHSAGARMGSALACKRADLVAALAAVSGLRAGRPDPANPAEPDPSACQPQRPVPVLSLHGDLDQLNPYQGGGAKYWRYSVPAAVRAWQRIDGCDPEAGITRVRVHVTIHRYGDCRDHAEVASFEVHDGGHTWPGSRFNDPIEVTGPINFEVNASRTIWAFLAKQRIRKHVIPQ